MDLKNAIEKTRRDLLELTARNRLVHTPLEGKRANWIAIDDEQTDQVFDLLVRNAKSMTFLPSATEERSEVNDSDDNDRQEFLRAFDGGASARPSDEDAYSSFEEPNDSSNGDTELAERHTDLFLQTRIEKDKLHDRLLRCFYDARTAEEEQGVSILYLACGFLKWQEARNSNVNRYAPLILIPVELTRNSARSKFRLSFREDELVTNLSIQARLQQDFGIRLPDLPEAPQDDDNWTPTDYFNQIRQLISGRNGWQVLDNEILLWFFSFTKFLMFRDLSTDAWPKGCELDQHKLIRGLLGDGFTSVGNIPPTVGDEDAIDTALSPADVIHVTDADSSQAIVIDEIAKGRNLVVQGPPGTGKSQTITNAIAAAVHAGKHVLFVSEKMAALEVVKRRLDHIGLGPLTLELHSHKARKREVLEELKTTLGLGVPVATKSLPTAELRQASLRLRQHDDVLHSPVGQTGCSPYQAMGCLLLLRAAGRQAPNYQVPKLTENTPEQYQAIKQVADDLDQLLNVSGSPRDNAWQGVRCQPMVPADLERLTSKLEGLRLRTESLCSANADLASALGLPPPDNINETSALAQLAAHIRRCPDAADRSTLAAMEWDSQSSQLRKTVATVAERRNLLAKLAPQVHESAWECEWSDVRIALAAHGRSWLRFFNRAYREAMAKLHGVCNGSTPKAADSRVALVDAIREAQRMTSDILKAQDLCRRLLGRVWNGVDTELQSAQAVVDWVEAGLKVPLAKEHARHITVGMGDPQSLAEPLGRIAQLLKNVDNDLAEVLTLLKLDTQRILGTSQPRQVAFKDWLPVFTRWLSAPEQLSHYLATSSRIEKLRIAGLDELASEIECGILKAGDVALQLESIRHESVIATAWRERPMLAEFHGDTYEKLRTRFAELDQQQIALSRLEVARKHHQNLPASSADSGQVSIVRREINKKRRHLPIRRLLKEAGHAIQKIKPVFMMSPLSVAQFLEPGAVEFDLLVIDEASQVQPVDALGAIARSKQIVVVGDQRQLPPTNFFGRISGEELEDDEAESPHAGDIESILGLCEAQGLPSRMLRWHYRSKHESLIAVSNRQFYENRLFIVPSPLISGGPLGLKMRYVADGWYDRGGSRVNRNEAIAVADAVMDHARNRPALSLGVATFSSVQRDAIIDELELRRRDDPSLEEFFSSGGPAPFFVKSLENVQGDERDVVYISVGYAKDQDGYFAQNFGPLNRKGGERRLNVLISRASAACEVFTSLKAADIDLARTQSEGVAALKMYLNYAEHGRLEAAQSHGDADSVFEEQVAAALRGRGLEVDHQIGVSGFYIDLAIRDPNRRGRYLLGIECDGAQYHSARWVRDRDRLRQQILESRGWIIHRIWSTDWFQRPQEQLERTLSALANATKHWDEADKADCEASTVIAGRIQPKKEEHHHNWDRVELADGGSTGDDINAYQEAVVNVRGFSGGPADLDVEELSRLIKLVVDVESPIHCDEIGRRCITILGQGRLVASLKRKVDSAIGLLVRKGELRRSNDFVFLSDHTEFPVRNRRNLANSNLRKVEYISKEELQSAVVRAISDNIGTDSRETSGSVARLFGINNSRRLQESVDSLINEMTTNSVLCDRGGKLFVP